MGKFKRDIGFALECARLYRSGVTVVQIAKQLRCCYATARAALARQGVEVGPGSAPPHTNPYDALVREAFARGASYAAIAQELGITRQRVHQIAKRLGLSFRERRSERLATRPPTRESQAKRYARKCARIRELWAEGLAVRQIAEKLGVSLSACMGTITRMRKAAPDSLPHRIPTERGPAFQDKLARMHACWLAGESAPELANKFGYLNAESFSIMVHRMRKRYPDLFPRRRPPRELRNKTTTEQQGGTQ